MALEVSESSLKRSSSLLAVTSTSPTVSMSPLPMSTDSSSATTVNGYEVFPGLPRIPGITRTKMGFWYQRPRREFPSSNAWTARPRVFSMLWFVQNARTDHNILARQSVLWWSEGENTCKILGNSRKERIANQLSNCTITSLRMDTQHRILSSLE